MEKVKLTQEQENAINELREEGLSDTQIIYGHMTFMMPLQKSLATINTDELIRALYIGYEVEPVFKVGDWVTDNLSLITGKIKLINQDCYKLDTNISVSKGMAKHSTRDAIKEEKRRRTEEKLDGILLSLTDTERIRMQNKLNCEDVSF